MSDTSRWIWALARIFLGAVQMTSALIGVMFLIATGPGALTLGMVLLAGACTVLSRVLFSGQLEDRLPGDAKEGGVL